MMFILQQMKHDKIDVKVHLSIGSVYVCVCISMTSGVSPGHGRDGWHTACPQIRLAFLMNVIGSVKNILNDDEQMASFTPAA